MNFFALDCLTWSIMPPVLRMKVRSGSMSPQARYSIALVEQPTPDGDYAALARVRRETNVSVMADDICFNLVHAQELVRWTAGFDFPAGVKAILSTYALTQVPECAEVIAHGAAALCAGGRWVVLDLKVPGNTPGWLAQVGTATVRPRRLPWRPCGACRWPWRRPRTTA